MLKKIGLVTAALLAGAFPAGGVAAADTPDGFDSTGQFGALNLGDTDALHNVDGTVGFCDNTVNVLGVQVPLHDVGNVGQSPDSCAGEGLSDGGTGMGG